MDILKAVEKASEIAEQFKYLEIREALTKVRLEAIDLAEQLITAREENLVLREATRLRDEFEFEDNVYWTKSEAGRVGPYCPKCKDGESKLVRMSIQDDGWFCQVCGVFIDKGSQRRRHNHFEDEMR